MEAVGRSMAAIAFYLSYTGLRLPFVVVVFCVLFWVSVAVGGAGGRFVELTAQEEPSAPPVYRVPAVRSSFFAPVV